METKTKWVTDPVHSEIAFKVKHLMITNVKGSFGGFNAEVLTEGNDFSTALISFTADASSITTGVNDRDVHLKSADFFDVEKYKEISFNAESMEKVDDENYKLNGTLTIKGVNKPVQLDVEFGGLMTDPWGNQKAGFTMNGKINRKDWGLNWNAALEAGGVLLSDEVKISCEVQLVKVNAN